MASEPGSSVGIAIDYGLGGPGFQSRWEARFSALVHTGPGAHTASCKMGTGSFPEVNCGRGVLLTTHPLLVPRSWKSRTIPVLSLRAFVAYDMVQPTYIQSLTLWRITLSYVPVMYRYKDSIRTSQWAQFDFVRYAESYILHEKAMTYFYKLQETREHVV
jgi:hypothetical protein